MYVHCWKIYLCTYKRNIYVQYIHTYKHMVACGLSDILHVVESQGKCHVVILKGFSGKALSNSICQKSEEEEEQSEIDLAVNTIISLVSHALIGLCSFCLLWTSFTWAGRRRQWIRKVFPLPGQWSLERRTCSHHKNGQVTLPIQWQTV